MAEPTDLQAQVDQALQELDSGEIVPPAVRGRGSRVEESQAKRTRAIALRLAGYTYEQIGETLGFSGQRAKEVISHTLNRAENAAVAEMRELENARLDRLQAAIWAAALKGDMRAIDRVLKISQQRAKLNGLDAPQKVDLSVGIKTEMEEAMQQLEALVLEGEVIEHGTD